MDAPTCRLCGKQHWLRGLCRLAEPTPETSCPECAIKDEAIRALQAQLDKLESNPAHTTGSSLTASNAVFDKKAYQREYMRRRRAAARAV